MLEKRGLTSTITPADSTEVEEGTGRQTRARGTARPAGGRGGKQQPSEE